MRKFILGTDWFTDCDDAAAVRLLARAHKAGQIKLCGIIINACLPQSVSSLYGFLKSEGLTDIPIGLDKNATYMKGQATYQLPLAELAPEIDNSAAFEPVGLYRKILSEEDRVEIIEIGFEQVIGQVIESAPNCHSEKNGMELLKEKCPKIWVMGGRWCEKNGWEYNISDHLQTRVGAKILCEKCPCPLVFSGNEIGEKVLFGKNIDRNDILFTAMEAYGTPHGRSAYDPMTVLLALAGDTAKAGYRAVYGSATVDTQTGHCNFTENEKGKDCYTIKLFEDAYYEKELDRRLS